MGRQKKTRTRGKTAKGREGEEEKERKMKRGKCTGKVERIGRREWRGRHRRGEKKAKERREGCQVRERKEEISRMCIIIH